MPTQDQEVQEAQVSEQQRVNGVNSRKRKKKTAFIYGNYPFYYGYRVGRALEEDPRISVFKREWIENKDCLDIGCNEGHVTIALAVKFCCKSMLGVDIDSGLIFKARSNLQAECEAAKEAKNEGTNPSSSNEKERTSELESEKRLRPSELLQTITFRTQNYLESRVCPEAYDTILCLSVSKWIHLNWGDDGLLKFFTKVFRELRPGGFFLLEPQPWVSYNKKRRVSEVARTNYKEIVLRPEDFPSLLTEKIGFKSCEEISSELPSGKSGFRRPLFVYRK